MKNQAIDSEIAFSELKELVNTYSNLPKSDEEIKEEFPVVLSAIEQGFLTINENVPTLKLKEPLLSEEGNFNVEIITFKTRIRPLEYKHIFAGANLKNSFEISLKAMAFLTSEPQAILNKLSKYDYTVVQQLSSLFL